MKVGVIHVLPVEYYPPTRNLIESMVRRAGWKVRAWSSVNRRSGERWSCSGARVDRQAYPAPLGPLVLRMPGYLWWHVRTALALARWRPDAVVSVEPHSALAVWIYYRLFRGSARLFIHHHEYYAPEDYFRPGMRLMRLMDRLERQDLLPRASRISQTNATRLRLFQETRPEMAKPGSIMPNYPPASWASLTQAGPDNLSGTRRLVYVGSASFEDTYIREVAVWVAGKAGAVTLHVCGDNIHQDVWKELEELGSRHITLEKLGRPYPELPDLFREFDVGLVLYRGNTLNFIHNVPNKAVEYLRCGLEVWYPQEMEGLRDFHERHPSLPLIELNFNEMPDTVPASLPAVPENIVTAFTCEAALEPLFEAIEGR